MPFYTFICHSCGEKFEIRCAFAEKENGDITCPACGANELDRVFEGFSVVTAHPSCPAEANGCPRQNGGCCGQGGGCCGQG